jgi:hypothetical protein
MGVLIKGDLLFTCLVICFSKGGTDMDIQDLKYHLNELNRQENTSWVSHWELDFPGFGLPPTGVSYETHYKNTFQNMMRDLQALPAVLNFILTVIRPAPAGVNQLMAQFNALNLRTEINVFSRIWQDARKIVNRTQANQQTLLHLALANSASNPVIPLIHLTDDFKFVNDQHETALFLAAKDDNNLICYALMNAGASPTPNALISQSPFSMAIRKRNISLIEEMLEKRADVHSKDFEGNTPLHYVKDAEVMKLLLAKGADPLATNKSGQTPLDCINQRIADGHDIDPHGPRYLVQGNLRMTRRAIHCFRLEAVESYDPFVEQQQAVKQVLLNALNLSAPARPSVYSRLFSRAEPTTTQHEPRRFYAKLL